MRNIRLTSERVDRSSRMYDRVNALYEAAFPADERAPLDMLVDGKDWNGDFRAYSVSDETEASPRFCGLAFSYVDDRFCYLFYLAVEPSMRKLGIGSAIIGDIVRRYPGHSMILEMEELDPQAENYQERLNRSRFYQSNGLHLTNVHNCQCGVSYHVLCADTSITLDDYRRMWHNIVRIQGYTPEEGRKWLAHIFGPDFVLP